MKANHTDTPRGRRLVVSAAAFLAALAVLPAVGASADSKDTASDASRKVSADSLPLGSLYHVVDQIGARDLWEKGFSGEGINIALIDTGFAPVPELIGSDRIVAAVDLSTEAGVPEATYIDNYGHGTHMAGIIDRKSTRLNSSH